MTRSMKLSNTDTEHAVVSPPKMLTEMFVPALAAEQDLDEQAVQAGAALASSVYERLFDLEVERRLLEPS